LDIFTRQNNGLMVFGIDSLETYELMLVNYKLKPLS